MFFSWNLVKYGVLRWVWWRSQSCSGRKMVKMHHRGASWHQRTGPFNSVSRCFSSGASLKQPARMYYGLSRNCDTFVRHSRLTPNSKPPRASLFNQIELAASMPFGKIVAAHSFRCTVTGFVLTMTGFLLDMTEFFLSMPGFFLKTT